MNNISIYTCLWDLGIFEDVEGEVFATGVISISDKYGFVFLGDHYFEFGDVIKVCIFVFYQIHRDPCLTGYDVR